MFVEPDCAHPVDAYTAYGCPRCPAPKYITLVQIAFHGRSESTLLICSNVYKTYLQDLHTLYTGLPPVHSPPPYERVDSITVLRVPQIVDPKEWLNCIQWLRFYRVDETTACLELFVKRPRDSTFYYALGPEGKVLVNRHDVDETLHVHGSTVQVWSGADGNACRKPTLMTVDEAIV